MCQVNLFLLVRNNFYSIMFIFIAILYMFLSNEWFSATDNPPTWPNQILVLWSNWYWWVIKLCGWLELMCSLSHCGTPGGEMFSVSILIRTRLGASCYQTFNFTFSTNSIYPIYFRLNHSISLSTPQCTLW